MGFVYISCRDGKCKTNHFVFFHDKNGYHAEFYMVHFKNESAKKQCTIPLAPKLMEKIVYLEKGRQAVYPRSPTLFHKGNGSVFAAPYFSTYCARLMTFGNSTFHAIAMRHVFATSLREFAHSPKSKLLQRAIDELERDCATLMGNKPTSWDAAYDEGSSLTRKISLAIAHWPDFEAFVKETDSLLKSRKPFDPLKIDIAVLQST